MDTRAQLVALLNSNVLSGGRRTTAAGIRQFENSIITSVINLIDDKDTPGGYLGIDSNGRVNVSFINSATPVGSFLRDDGTWASALVAAPNLQAVLGAGNNTGGNDILVEDADNIYVGNLSVGRFHYNFPSTRVEVSNMASGDLIYFGDAGGITAMLSSGQFMRLENDQFLAQGNVAGTAFLLTAAASNQMYHPAANYFNSPLHNFVGDVTLASETASTLPWINGSKAVKSGSIVADGNGLYFLSGYGIDTTATGGTDSLNIGSTNADVINIGRAGIQVNIFGNRNFIQTTDTEITDSLITLNKGGSVGSGFYVGFEIEENALITGYWKTTVGRDGWLARVPAINADGIFDFSTLTGNRTWTLPDASGTFILSSTLSATGFVQGGNAFGATAVLGTTDANNLNIISNSVVVARFTTAGAFETNGGNGTNSDIAIHQTATSAAGAGRIMDVYNNSYSKQMLAILDNGVTGLVYLAAGALEINPYNGQSTFTGGNVVVRGTVAGNDHLAIPVPGGTGGIYFSDTAGNPRMYIQNSGSATVGEILSSGVSYLSGGAFDMRATGGSGYLGIYGQSSAPAAGVASSLRLYAGASGAFSWIRNDNVSDTYTRTLDGTLTANRTYTLPDASGTLPLGTGASDRISFWSGTNTLSSNANFIFDSTNVGLVVGTTALINTTDIAVLQKDQNNFTLLNLKNTSTGISGAAQLNVLNSTSSGGFGIFSTGATATTLGIVRANYNYIVAASAGLMIYTNNTGNIIFGTNNAERGRFLGSGGQFLVGLTALTNATNIADFQLNQNAGTRVAVTNTTSGTSAFASIGASNHVTISTGTFIVSTSAGYTPSGMFKADAGHISNSKPNGLVIGTNVVADLFFNTNSVDRGVIGSGGDVRFGNTTALAVAGTPIFSVNQSQNAISMFEMNNVNTGTSSRVAWLMGYSSTKFATLQRYGAAFTGNHIPNTSVALADSLYLHNTTNATQGTGIMAFSGTPIYFFASATTTNHGLVVNIDGVRIDQNQNLHTAPAAALHVVKTTEQLRIGYDASNYFGVTVSSAGVITFNAAGASASFVFSDSLEATIVKATTVAGFVSSDGSAGATGTFTTADFKTVTVKDGIVTSIV